MSLALVAGVALSACQAGPPSLMENLRVLSGEVGGDVVSLVLVEQPEGKEEFDVRAVFITHDGAAKEAHRSTAHDQIRVTSATLPVATTSGKRIDELDLNGLERRMRELKGCSNPYGRIFVFGGHVNADVRCKVDGDRSGLLDGAPVAELPTGDLPTAARQLLGDAALADAKAVGQARIGMEASRSVVEVQVVDPAPTTVTGTPCQIFLKHIGDSLVASCGAATYSRFPVELIRPDAIERIWQAEGAPGQGWELSLEGGDQPYWQAIRGKRRTTYTLDGEPR